MIARSNGALVCRRRVKYTDQRIGFSEQNQMLAWLSWQSLVSMQQEAR
jgi:hypothetical protein